MARKATLISVAVVLSMGLLAVVVFPQTRSTLCTYQADLELSQGRRSAALDDYQSALAIWSGNMEAARKAAALYEEAGQFSQASDLFSSFYKSAQTRLFALENLCSIALAQKDFNQALRLSDEWISLDKNSSRALHDQGIAYEGLGRNDDALASFDESIRLDPTSSAGLDKDLLLSKTRTLDLAVDSTFTPRLEKKNEYNALMRDSMRIFYSLSYSPAIEKITEAIRLKPDQPGGYYLRGIFLEHIRRLTEALQDFKKTRQCSRDKTVNIPKYVEVDIFKGAKNRPDHWPTGAPSEVLRREADVLCKLNRYDEALTCYNKAIELNKSSRILYLGRADAWSHLGKFDKAAVDNARAAQLNKRSPPPPDHLKENFESFF